MTTMMFMEENKLRMVGSPFSLNTFMGFLVISVCSCVLLCTEAQVVEFEFNESEGFINGEIAHHRSWISNKAANSVDTDGTGSVFFDDNIQWANSVCTLGLSPVGSRITVSANFTFFETEATGDGDLFSLIINGLLSANSIDMRAALRRTDDVYLLSHKHYDGSVAVSGKFDKFSLGFDGSIKGVSDELCFSASLLRGENDTDWTLLTTLSNLTRSTEVMSFTQTNVVTSKRFFNEPYLFFGFSSSMRDKDIGVQSRRIERLKVERVSIGPETPREPFVDLSEPVIDPAALAITDEASIQVVTTNQVYHALPEYPAAEEVALYRIPKMLKKLHRDEKKLRKELETLPKLTESQQYEAFGYHSGYLPALSGLPDKPRWTLDFTFAPNISLSEIILVPAIDHRFGRARSYGFPTRFRVSAITVDGSLEVLQEWLEADCSDPGRFPMIIEVPHALARKVRIEVYRGRVAGSREFFALDEVFGIMGDTERLCHSVTVNTEYESLPYWGKQYLIDKRTSLGLPLDVRDELPASGDNRDFVLAFDSAPTNECVIELDLGRNRTLGYLTLYPAQSPGDIRIPGYGFPDNVSLEVVEATDSGERGIRRSAPWSWSEMQPGNNVVQLAGADMKGRWIRLYMNNFPVHNVKNTFALGEIHIHNRGETYPVEKVSLEGFPKTTEANAQRLVDGRAGGYPILFILDWLQKIERRNHLELSLKDLTFLERALQSRWQGVWQISGYSLVLILALTGISTAVVTVIQRRRYVKRLRMQISSDLHDDVGALLGSSILAGTKLERRLNDERSLNDVQRILNFTTKAMQGLRDIVWISNTEHDTLRHLVAKLRETAEVYSDLYTLEFNVADLSTLADFQLSVASKRDIFLIVKEALHNIHKHARARRIEVRVEIFGGKLKLSIKDDGIGFDEDEMRSEDHIGFGLRNMKKRAEHLGGTLFIQSAPQTGSKVVLEFPIKKARRVKLSGDNYG